jgi:putative membrane protein
MDWIQAKKDVLTAPLIYKWMGTVRMNRLDAPHSTKFPEATSISAMRKLILLLRSKEAILIFPEAWPNIDSHYTPKQTKEEFLPLQRGFLSCLEEAQKRPREIPLVPIGLIYDEMKKTILVNFGRPLYYDITSENRKDNKKYDTIRQSFMETVTNEIMRLSGL